MFLGRSCAAVSYGLSVQDAPHLGEQSVTLGLQIVNEA